MKVIAKDVTVADVHGLSELLRGLHAQVQAEAERSGRYFGLKLGVFLSLLAAFPMVFMLSTGHAKLVSGDSVHVTPGLPPAMTAGGMPASLGTVPSGDPRDPLPGPPPRPASDSQSFRPAPPIGVIPPLRLPSD